MAKFRLNYKGGAEVLKSPEVAGLINTEINAIADDIGDDAEVDEYTTDRAAGAVSVPPALQASDGALTRAAAKRGLEVKPK